MKKNEIENYVYVYLGKLKVYVSTFFIFYLGKGKKDAESRFSVGQKIIFAEFCFAPVSILLCPFKSLLAKWELL